MITAEWRDVLENACLRIWREIDELLPDATPRENAERWRRLSELRAHSRFYREVLRREAWARAAIFDARSATKPRQSPDPRADALFEIPSASDERGQIEPDRIADLTQPSR